MKVGDGVSETVASSPIGWGIAVMRTDYDGNIWLLHH